MPESTDIIGESLPCDIEQYKNNVMRLWNRKWVHCWKVKKWWKEEGWEVMMPLGHKGTAVDVVLTNLVEITEEDEAAFWEWIKPDTKKKVEGGDDRSFMSNS